MCRFLQIVFALGSLSRVCWNHFCPTWHARNRKIGSIITTRKGCATFDSRFLILQANGGVVKILILACILLPKFKKLGSPRQLRWAVGRPRQIGCDSRSGRSDGGSLPCDDYEHAFSFPSYATRGFEERSRNRMGLCLSVHPHWSNDEWHQTLNFSVTCEGGGTIIGRLSHLDEYLKTPKCLEMLKYRTGTWVRPHHHWFNPAIASTPTRFRPRGRVSCSKSRCPFCECKKLAIGRKQPRSASDELFWRCWKKGRGGELEKRASGGAVATESSTSGRRKRRGEKVVARRRQRWQRRSKKRAKDSQARPGKWASEIHPFPKIGEWRARASTGRMWLGRDTAITEVAGGLVLWPPKRQCV